MESKKFKIALIGATGAVGSEIVKIALNDPRYSEYISELTVVVRRKLPFWEEMRETN